MLKIDKNVPRPPSGGEYPFGEMRVGDSFLAPFGERDYGSLRADIHNKFSRWKRVEKMPDARVVTRSEDHGIRVWMEFLK